MKKYTFTAKIQSAPRGGAFVLFPYDTQKEFGTIARVPVKVMFDGKVPYTGTIARYGHPQHMLGLLKAVQEQLGKKPGDTVDVVLWKDEAVRTVEVPADFAALLKKEKLQATFDQLSYTHRKEYCRWITEAKKEETRARRLAKSVEMLHRGIKTPG
ncbi:MAG TPA: YdeI/OmpD-associated family protein [Acidobacteriaceae bacterium]|nr:YdeI/OmpD-associated family protein [Acidobacteriaceae bacterium]